MALTNKALFVRDLHMHRGFSRVYAPFAPSYPCGPQGSI